MARMSQLLDEALALDEAGRRTWLERATQEHPDIAAALREALLPGAAQAADLKALMSLPKLGAADGVNTPAASGLQPGARVGPYELIRRLGAGGMAEVWLARRADGAFRREVALKLPMLAHAQAGLEERFARERDILASLEHPHIARLYDAGVDSQGLPYLAMEYVQGAPLTDWCDSHRLGIPERLGLFLQVLEAAQYAHEKKVIHRDLKPSNILVTDSGQVRLLDFGVARLLEAETTDHTALTSVYGRALTPDYASPELLRGDPIDARSDLYALGVALYELLTGTRPYRLKSAASIGALDQAIATLQVKKPSLQLEQSAAAARAGTVERLARQVRGDLDAVVLKALAKEPTQRYASAAAMAEDLRRYLAGKPIQAQPDRLFYRLRKFVLRNGTLLGISAAALAAILAAVGYALYRESRAQVTVSAAATNVVSDKSIAVLPFVDMSEHKDQEYFSDGLSEELIDMLTKVSELRVPARTSSFYFKGKQATIADIAKALGVAHVLEGSVRKSGNTLRVTAQLIRADNGYHVWSETYDRKLEDIFKVQDEIANAVVTALRVHLLPTQPVVSHRALNPEAYNQLLLGRQFQNRASLDSFRRAVEAYSKAIALDPNYAAAYAGLAYAEAHLWDQTGDPGGMRRAEAAADRAVALAPEQADGYAARGFVRSVFSWDWAGAQSDFAKALLLDPTDSTVQRRFGSLMASLGGLPEAVVALRKATALDPLSNGAWEHLGRYLTFSRDFAGAHEALHRALEIQPESPYGLNDLGELLLLEGNAAEALAMFRKIVNEDFRLAGIAMAEHTVGRAKESQQALDELIAKYAHEAAFQIAYSYAWRGEKDKAFDWLERAYQQRDGGLAEVKGDPLLASLRGDLRYKALLHKMNLPE
jgi:serine/threonine-protein kinase